VNADVPVVSLFTIQPVHTSLCLLVGDCLLACFSAMKMEAVRSSETLVKFCPSTRHYIPEDNTLHNQDCENVKTNACIFFSAKCVHINMIGHVNITCRPDLFLKEANSRAIPYAYTERCGRPKGVAVLTRRTAILTHISHYFP
jgi:hypothetical protein